MQKIFFQCAGQGIAGSERTGKRSSGACLPFSCNAFRERLGPLCRLPGRLGGRMRSPCFRSPGAARFWHNRFSPLHMVSYDFLPTRHSKFPRFAWVSPYPIETGKPPWQERMEMAAFRIRAADARARWIRMFVARSTAG